LKSHSNELFKSSGKLREEPMMSEILLWTSNVVLTAGGVWIWLETRKQSKNAPVLPHSVNNEHFESQIAAFESRLQKLEQIFEEKSKIMDVMYEQLNRALKNQKLSFSYPLTQEESELKEAMYLGIEKDEIPSVRQFESTKLRLQKESSLDLRTLLKGQLS